MIIARGLAAVLSSVGLCLVCVGSSRSEVSRTSTTQAVLDCFSLPSSTSLEVCSQEALGLFSSETVKTMLPRRWPMFLTQAETCIF